MDSQVSAQVHASQKKNSKHFENPVDIAVTTKGCHSTCFGQINSKELFLAYLRSYRKSTQVHVRLGQRNSRAEPSFKLTSTIESALRLSYTR